MGNFLNKRKIQGVVKYLVQQKEFMAEYDTQEREEDLKNTKKVVVNFEESINVEVSRQDMIETINFKREELPEKYTAKILYE